MTSNGGHSGPAGPGGPNGDGGGEEHLDLSIKGLRTRPGESPGEIVVDLNTTRGVITVHLAPCEGTTGCVIFLGGAGGGVRGPAGEVFVRLGPELVADGVTALRVEYRQPGEFEECVLDALAACSFLKGIGATEAVAVGHSFGAAVAIKAAELSPLITAVASISAQRYGTQDVHELNKPLLLIHGDSDEILDRAASDDIFSRASEPKQLEIVSGGHGLLEDAERVHDLLSAFIVEHAGERPGTSG